MKFSYDKKADALYIRFNAKPVFESDQVADNLIVDYDKSGRIIALEVLDASKKMAKDFQMKLLKNRFLAPVEFISNHA